MQRANPEPAEEAIKPHGRFAAAGRDITAITPDGRPLRRPLPGCRGSPATPRDRQSGKHPCRSTGTPLPQPRRSTH